MKIQNIQGYTAVQLQQEVDKGARFVYYHYTISLIFFILKRHSEVYMIRAGESALRKGIRFTIISALFGWWGIPFGPKYTVNAIRNNCKGGTDVTDEVMATVAGHILFQESQRERRATA